MSNILKKICEDKNKEINLLKNKCSLKTLKKLISDKIEKRNFKNRIIESANNKNNFIIGEIKKASPSAGKIIKDYDPVDIAKTYENAGIDAISILTESNYFDGEIDHLSLIKQNTVIPILRKDFIIDEYQIYESKVYQADIILLIISILSDYELKCFLDISKELKEDVKSKNNFDKTDENFKHINDINTLTITDLNFGYEDKKNLIKNLNINLKKGQFTALIGNTGSGKTTLIDIILGLIKPHSGKLVVNHKHELKDFKKLNHLVGYVPQEIYLSDTSIIKNIAVGINEKDIDIAQVKKVIELSQLNKFVESLEEGIYSKVGDRAFRISGGQKQRIGIARALYRNPKILIMDESTNSLDEQTEQSFLKDIKIISKELITIFITHKIKNLNYCDVIYKLENGKLN